MWNLWNIRYLGKSKALRGLAKRMFRLWFYDGRVIKVQRGPLKDLLWKCSNDQQFWMPLGVYEKETTKWITAQLNNGDVFFDVGANYGYFTLMAGRVVGNLGRVFSFEPIPENCELIEDMVGLNGYKNVKVMRVAISDRTGEVEFVVENNNANSHISDFGLPHASSNVRAKVSVKTVSLDEYCEANDVVPNVVKCDVEGAEVAVLLGAKRLLERNRTKWIISTHSKELEARCRDIMTAAGYRVETLEGFHHELLCTPL